MRLPIYRSVVHTLYPEEMISDLFAFHPIPAEDRTRDDRLQAWTSESGLEPFAVIEIPVGSKVIHGDAGLQLLVPDKPCGLDAEEVLELAMDQCFGLSVVRLQRFSMG
jgi:hypothetical protein